MARNQGRGKSPVLEAGEGSNPPLRAGRKKDAATKEKLHGLTEQVSDLFGKLNLTAKESKVVILDDTEDTDLTSANHVVIGKVLAPNSLPLQTIMAAMQPA